jgi:hypothetical protein
MIVIKANAARSWQEERKASARMAGPAEQKLTGALQCADPSVEKSEQLFVLPSDMKGGPAQCPPSQARSAPETVVC